MIKLEMVTKYKPLVFSIPNGPIVIACTNALDLSEIFYARNPLSTGFTEQS